MLTTPSLDTLPLWITISTIQWPYTWQPLTCSAASLVSPLHSVAGNRKIKSAPMSRGLGLHGQHCMVDCEVLYVLQQSTPLSARSMLQVGYGDIGPTTALEEMTAVFLMLIGEHFTMRTWH